jgi:hypothetical protein
MLTANVNPVFIGHMKTKIFGLTLAFCFLAATMCFAADPQMGTWRLNESKSKLGAGTGKNSIVTYKSILGNVKVTIDGVDAEGKPAHNAWTGKFDGKDYPVTGDPNTDWRSYRRVNDHTLEFAQKKAGKTLVSGHIVVSANGKSRTVNASGTNPKGKKFKSTAVYDKE